MAMPSSMPIVLKMKGTPPASRTIRLTSFPISFKCACPGMQSVYEFAMAMNGLSQSASDSMEPVARNS